MEVLSWPVHKVSHCSMSPEQQAHRCVSQPNQQNEAIFDFFPEGVIHKSLSNINRRLNKKGGYSGNTYICTHFRPRPFIKGLASCWYCTVDVFNIPFSNISNHFSRARVISWKCFPWNHKKIEDKIHHMIFQMGSNACSTFSWESSEVFFFYSPSNKFFFLHFVHWNLQEYFPNFILNVTLFVGNSNKIPSLLQQDFFQARHTWCSIHKFPIYQVLCITYWNLWSD